MPGDDREARAARPATAPLTGVSLIRRALARHRRRLAGGYPLIAVWQLCETLVPVAIGVIIDRGIATGDAGDFAVSLLLLVALFAILSNSYRFGSRLIFRSLQEEAHLLRTEVAEHVLHPRGARTTTLPGETLSLATSDADTVAAVLHQLAFAIAALISLVVVAVYVLQVDLTLGLLILLGVPTVVLVIQVVTPLIARRTTSQQQSTASASGMAGDLVQGLRPLKGIGGEDVALTRYRGASQQARDDTIAVARSWGYLTGLTTGLSGLLLAAVTIVAGQRALDGDISVGQLIALVGLTQFLAEPLSGLGQLSAQFAASRASATRIVTFLATPRLLTAGDASATTSQPQISLRGVCSEALDDISFATVHGELLGLVIDDPSTSDELVKLLTGTSTPLRGAVAIGDVELAELSITSRREHLLVNPHHTEIFEGTLREVVDPGATLDADELAAVLQASAADDVVALHPDGLDRIVRAGGTTLSGGQRQRLALARALAVRAPLLVLQDPTSAVDSVTEQAIADGLRALRAPIGATVLITSSPALLQQADRVLLLRDGRIMRSGTHAELTTHPDYRAAVLR